MEEKEKNYCTLINYGKIHLKLVDKEGYPIGI
jgi:hypothetical protein